MYQSKRPLLFTLMTVFLLLNACSDDDKNTIIVDIEPITNTHVGYLRIPFNGSVSTIDPGLISDLAQIEVVEQLFLGLTDFDPVTFEAIPELATHWDINKAGDAYVFHLRKDVTWTNGSPVTAHDIVYAIQRNLAPEFKAPSAFTLFVLKNAESYHNQKKGIKKQDIGVKALDDYTIEFSLNHPAGYFPALASMWTFRPLPQKLIETYPEQWTTPEKIQTNGSYRLDTWDKGSRIILKKNNDYYEKLANQIPEIHYYIVPENSIGLTMYENNELDIIGGQTYLRLPKSELPNIQSSPLLRQQRHTSPILCTEWYGFNTQKPPVNNKYVRRAIAAAINKPLLIDVIVKGKDKPAETFTRPPIFGSVDPSDSVGISYNPDQAKKWLAKAGYPKGKNFPEIVLMHHTSETHKAIAMGIKTMLKHNLNIDIKVESKEWDPYMDNLDQPNTPHMFRMSWCADYPDANNWLHEVFHPTKGINWIGWKNKQFADLVDRAQRSPVAATRKKLYRRAEKILTNTSAAIIPLYYSEAQFLVKPWVKNWYNMAFGGQHIRNWQLTTNSQKQQSIKP